MAEPGGICDNRAMASLLFSPLALGPRVAKNRIMRLPTISNLGEKSRVSEAMIAHVRRIGQGGAQATGLALDDL